MRKNPDPRIDRAVVVARHEVDVDRLHGAGGRRHDLAAEAVQSVGDGQAAAAAPANARIIQRRRDVAASASATCRARVQARQRRRVESLRSNARVARSRARSMVRRRAVDSSVWLQHAPKMRQRARKMGLDAALTAAHDVRRRGDVEAFPDAQQERLALPQRQLSQCRFQCGRRLAAGKPRSGPGSLGSGAAANLVEINGGVAGAEPPAAAHVRRRCQSLMRLSMTR